eukprot:7379315-Prymnesium_polylepis.1
MAVHPVCRVGERHHKYQSCQHLRNHREVDGIHRRAREPKLRLHQRQDEGKAYVPVAGTQNGRI